MKLEHISAVLRPRSDAEAADLGLAMVRRHAGGIYKAWFTLIIPLWALLGLFLHNYPSAMVLVVWWLKPLYDRVVLFYLGRALFGAAPTLQEQWREWPKLLGKRLGWLTLGTQDLSQDGQAGSQVGVILLGVELSPDTQGLFQEPSRY